MKKIKSSFFMLFVLSSTYLILCASIFATDFENIDRNTVKIAYEIPVIDIFGNNATWTVGGTGGFISPTEILTVSHIASGYPRGQFYVYIRYPDATKYVRAKLKRYRVGLDLMVIEISEEDAITWKPLELADNYELGEDIIFAGYTVLSFPKIRFGKLAKHADYGIMVDPTYSGDSGGIILNTDGQIVGIITRRIILNKPPSSQETFVGYGIPLETLKEFL